MGNIVLTGFMGTGKSAVGRRLAKELGLRFHDLDGLIEKETGASIKEVFRKHGEDCFRKMESAAIKRLTSGEFGDGVVISTGGGAVVNISNRDALKKWGTIVCLTAEPEEILKRVGDRDDRPLLATGDKRKSIEKLLKEREEAYRDCDIMIDTTGVSIPEVVERIKGFLKAKA